MPPSRMTRGRKIARFVARVFLWLIPALVAAVALVGGAAFFWLRTEAGNDWLLGEVLGLIQPTNGSIEASLLRTDLLHHVELTGVRVRGPDGTVLVAADSLVAEVETQSLLGRVLPVHQLQVTGLDVQIGDFAVFGTMWPGDPNVPAKPWAGLPFDLLVDEVQLDGKVNVVGRAVDDVKLRAGLTLRGRQVAWTNLSFSGFTVAGPLTLGGAGSWEPEHLVLQSTAAGLGTDHLNRVELDGVLTGSALAFTLSAIHFDKDGLVPLVPELESVPLRSAVDLTGRLEGTLTDPRVAVTLTTAGGPLVVSGTVNPAEKTWSAVVDTVGFSSEPVLTGIEPATLDGHVEAHGTGWTWPAALTADATVDAHLRARGELITLNGPAHVEAGHIGLTGFRASTPWASANVSGDVDVPGSQLHLDIHDAAASLSRFGVQGHAAYVGALDVSWAGPVTARAQGAVSGHDFATQGATLASFRGTVDAGWNGKHPTGHAAVDLADAAYSGRHAASGTLVVDLGDTVGFTVGLAEPDRSILELDGSFGITTKALVLSTAKVEVSPGLILSNLGEQRATFVGGGVRDLAVALTFDSARINARGGVSAHGRDTLVVDFDSFSLGDLDRVVPGRFPGWLGMVSARLGLVGTLDKPNVEGVVHLSGLTIPGQVVGLNAELFFEGDGEKLKFDAGAGSGSRALLVASGELPLLIGRSGVRLAEAGPLRARVTVAPFDTAELTELLAGRTLPEARASAELRVAGTVKVTALTLVASADVPLATNGPTARVWLDAALSEGVVTTRLVLNQAFQSRLEADLAARLDVPALSAWLNGAGPKPDPKQLLADFGGAVLLKQLPLSTIRRFAPFPGDVDGALLGAFAISGSPFAPKLQGGVNVVGARVGQLDVSPATLDLTPLPGGYKIATKLGFNLPAASLSKAPTCAAKPGDSAGGVEVEGFIPLGDDFTVDHPGLALKVAGSGIPLAVAEAFSTSLLNTGGCLTLGGAVSGTLVDPKLAIGFNLSHGVSTLPTLGIRVEDIDIDGRLQDGKLVLDHAHAHTTAGILRLDSGSGNVDASGTLTLEKWLPKKAEATVRLDGVWLTATADRRARVSGDLEVRGSGPVLDVTGKITVDEAYLRLSERFFADARSTDLYPDIEVIRPGAKVAEIVAGNAAPFKLEVRPKLEVDLNRHLRISVALPLQGAYGDLARTISTVTVESEVDGVVKISQKAGELRLTGEVSTTRGDASVIGRPFEITDGTVAFTGADIKEPILNLHATHHADCGDIQVAISGVPGAPQLDFTSDVLPDRDAVLRALILGTCLESSSANAQDDALAQTLTLLTEVLSKQALSYGTSATATIFRLEKLEIDPSGTARVAIALGRNVFLTTEYTPTPATPDDNQFTVQLELALPYRWYLAIDTGDKGSSALSAYRKWRF